MKFKLLIVSLLLSNQVFAWGKKGHRIVGELAYRHLNQATKTKLKVYLGHESLAHVTNWPDEIKSDPDWNFANPWHYVSIPDGKSYKDIKKFSGGDILVALNRFQKDLKNPKADKKTKTIAIKFMAHLMGDLHQPLHVGRAEDKGGNTIKVKWFGKSMNLHRLWDEGMVEYEGYSFTEYSDHLNHYTKDELQNWRKGNFETWAKESQDARAALYDFGKNKKLGYEYHYRFKDLLHKRLRQAGLRLAHILNHSL